MMIFTLSLAVAGTPDIDRPLRTGSIADTDAAVVIGIEDYAFLPPVPHAHRDARSVFDTLVHTRGIPTDRVRMLQGANRDQILRAVAALGDVEGTAWVYFAGHGAAGPDGELRLVGDDARADALTFVERSIGLDELQKALPNNAVLMIDACHAGTRGGDELLPGARMVVPAYASESIGQRKVWTAASPGQIAGALDPMDHGLFTYFMVGAMRGWADGELDGRADGTVTMAEGRAYVSRALRTMTPDQVPKFSGPEDLELASGALELGPDLLAFAQLEERGGLAKISINDPYRRPFKYRGGAVYEDATGRTVIFDDLAAHMEGSALADRAVRRVKTAKGLRTGGTVVMGIGGGVGLVSAIAFGAASNRYDKKTAEWREDNMHCNATDGSRIFCDNLPRPDAPGALGHAIPSLSILGLGGAMFGVSFPIGSTGRVGLKRAANRHVVDRPDDGVSAAGD